MSKLLTGFVYLGVLVPASAWAQFGDWPAAQGSATSIPAQAGGDHGSLRGDIGGEAGAGLQVTLRGMNQGSQQTEVLPNGSFEFENLLCGTYDLNVVDRQGTLLHQEVVTITNADSSIHLRITRPRDEATPAATGTISLSRLRHKIPKAAVKELKAATKANLQHDHASTIRHLKKAAEIDPDCATAWNALGAKYLELRDAPHALESIRQALRIDASLSTAQANAAWALLLLNRPADAESAARQALRLDGTAPRNHYLLALALIMQRKYTEETLHNFELAADTIPRAHLGAAEVKEKMGLRADAREEVKQYMATGNVNELRPEMKSHVKHWMARISADTRQ